jgi:hypothetical protein
MLVEDSKLDFFPRNISRYELQSALTLYDKYSSIIFDVISTIVIPGDVNDTFIEAFYVIINSVEGYKQEYGSLRLWIMNTSRNVAIRKLITSHNEPFEEPLTLKKTVYSLYKLRNFTEAKISNTLHIPVDLVATLLQTGIKPSTAGN